MNEIQVDLAGQIATFWIAAALGAALCLLYDLFRILRYAHRPRKAAAFVQDVLWWCVCAVLTYGLLLVRCKGVVRFYALAGEVLGFAAFRATLSRAVLAAAKPVVRVCRGAFRWLRRCVAAPCCRFVKNAAKTAAQRLKIFLKILKKHLKRLLRLLYNPHSADTKRQRSKGRKR